MSEYAEFSAFSFPVPVFGVLTFVIARPDMRNIIFRDTAYRIFYGDFFKVLFFSVLTSIIPLLADFRSLEIRLTNTLCNPELSASTFGNLSGMEIQVLAV